MEMITAYLVGIVTLVGLWAWRVPHENIRTVFLLSVVWPFSILAVIGMIGLDAVGWNIDFANGTQAFGFRRPTNPDARGFAVTIFGIEFQFYAKRKNG